MQQKSALLWGGLGRMAEEGVAMMEIFHDTPTLEEWDVYQLSLVVLRELPEEDDTLILRLLGDGKSFRRGVATLMERPAEDPLHQLLVRILVAFHPELGHIFENEWLLRAMHAPTAESILQD